MKLRIGCLIVLFLTLLLPMAAQQSGGRAKSSAAAPIQVFNSAVRINGPSGGNDGQNAPVVLRVKGGQGGTSGVDNENGGNGGGIQLRAGDGGSGAQDAGYGGDVTITAGNGGTSDELAGGGGWITLQPGAAGVCQLLCNNPGNIILAVHGMGAVGVGTKSPSNTLEVKVGGTTLADSWSVRSSRRFKNNIEPLEGALAKVERLQGVSYERKDNGKREIGVVAEEVDKIVPEVVSRDPQTHEVQGVDYSRLTALLIEAVKAQEGEIRQLKTQIEQLSADQAGR
jgi:Chaperone of endosialidase